MHDNLFAMILPPRKWTAHRTVALALMITLLALTAPSQADAGAIVVPPHESVAGRSQAEWSEAWWQWAGSFSRAQSPIADTDGSRCAARQAGPVWFLAGTYGTKRTVRTCTVPAGKYLFFPLINYVVMPRSRDTTCASIRASARRITDEPSALLVDLDGQRLGQLERYRQATPECFNMGALANPPARVYPSAANGYYVMLEPLAPGRHELNFGGALPGMLQAVTYTLTVE